MAAIEGNKKVNHNIASECLKLGERHRKMTKAARNGQKWPNTYRSGQMWTKNDIIFKRKPVQKMVENLSEKLPKVTNSDQNGQKK